MPRHSGGDADAAFLGSLNLWRRINLLRIVLSSIDGGVGMRILGIIFFLAAGFCLAGPEPGSELVFHDLDNVPRRPLEPGDKIASVLIFYWQDCPISNGYAPELNRITASHTNFAFYIVQVDPELTPAAAREHARKFDLHPPVVLDPQHRLVKFAKATVTPEAVVIGRNGQILYR